MVYGSGSNDDHDGKDDEKVLASQSPAIALDLRGRKLLLLRPPCLGKLRGVADGCASKVSELRLLGSKTVKKRPSRTVFRALLRYSG